MIKNQTINTKVYSIICDKCCDEESTPSLYNNYAIDKAKEEGFQHYGTMWLCNLCIREIILLKISDLKVGDKVCGIGHWNDAFYTIKDLNYRNNVIIPDYDAPYKGAFSFGGDLPTSFSLVKKVE